VLDRRKGPIRSTLVDDAALERLDGFLLALGERLDLIQEADRVGELGEAGARALDLASDAAGLGLPALVATAERVAFCCRAGDAASAHDAILELTDVVRRVRLGHRGAAA
jgi:hypothetical protein